MYNLCTTFCTRQYIYQQVIFWQSQVDQLSTIIFSIFLLAPNSKASLPFPALPFPALPCPALPHRHHHSVRRMCQRFVTAQRMNVLNLLGTEKEVTFTQHVIARCKFTLRLKTPPTLYSFFFFLFKFIIQFPPSYCVHLLQQRKWQICNMTKIWNLFLFCLDMLCWEWMQSSANGRANILYKD